MADSENQQFTFDALDPIRGYPELRWAGKRPFTGINYYPAQLRETYGEGVDGKKSALFWGDNLQVMSHLLRDYRGQVQLIYIDPPYDSKADYKKTISRRGIEATSDRSAFEEAQYSDIWDNDGFFQYMFDRLVLMKSLLAKEGAIYVHLDSKRAHHIRLVMDEVFGPSRFRNEIIWMYKGNGLTNEKKRFPSFHGTILAYGNGGGHEFEPQREAGIAASVVARFGKYLDEDGCISFGALRKGNEKAELEKSTRRFISEHEREPQDDDVAVEYSGGALIRDVWTDIPIVRGSGRSSEFRGYPTQKPEALLERIILASSKPGDIVFDSFMGSGTTQHIAMKLGRRFLGCDINLGAIETTVKRLVEVAADLRQPKQAALNAEPLSTLHTGFDVYTVNHYDIFRNPVQARELLMDAIGIEPIHGGVFDGQKDGRRFKIMPINQIATKANLNDLLNNAPIGEYAKAAKEHPSEPVVRITLVCMGHEPDLAAYLETELQVSIKVPCKLDIEVLDILRDKADLQFKRDSEAKVVVKDGWLVVEAFYPMNLLQKLSWQKEEVKEWRELVDSIKVDFHYDGAVLNPEVIDIPDSKQEFVKGRYKLPVDVGTIFIKITDLLSESLEMEVKNG